EQALSRFLLVEGQSVLLLLSEGVGNNQCGSEEGPSSLLNRWLQPWGMHAHHDAVLRRRRHPRFPHPKEVFLSLSSLPETEDDQAGKDERQEEEKDPGFSFVYPYGCSLSVAPPAKVLLSSGPYSYPAHRPVLAAWEGRAEGEDGGEGKGAGRREEAGKEEEKRLNEGERGKGRGGGGAGGGGGRRGGRLVVLGAVDMWTDAWLDQEDNGWLADVIFRVGARKAPEGEGEGKERGGEGWHHSRPLVLPRSQWLLHREPDAESSAPPSNLGQASFSHDRSPSRLAQLLFCGDARPEQERAHDPALPPALPPSLQPRLCTPRVRDLAQQLRPCLQGKMYSTPQSHVDLNNLLNPPDEGGREGGRGRGKAGVPPGEEPPLYALRPNTLLPEVLATHHALGLEPEHPLRPVAPEFVFASPRTQLARLFHKCASSRLEGAKEGSREDLSYFVREAAEIVGLHDLSSSESASGGKELEAGKEEEDAAKNTLAVLVEQLARWKGRGGSG
ncbi:intraflagellar transport protein 52, partial [Nannochloropsis gaditana CCMP526]|uniref:intraflagellar transport protein 52 n=1 Tax=Nannochloropsis gaditana (strain CCMP526) TaxID=1093141 RepID=UPI00029F7FCA